MHKAFKLHNQHPERTPIIHTYMYNHVSTPVCHLIKALSVRVAARSVEEKQQLSSLYSSYINYNIAFAMLIEANVRSPNLTKCAPLKSQSHDWNYSVDKLNTFCLLVGSEGLQGVSSNSLETITKNSDWSSLLYEYWEPIFTSCSRMTTQVRT